MVWRWGDLRGSELLGGFSGNRIACLVYRGDYPMGPAIRGMRPESVAMARELLAHHQHMCDSRNGRIPHRDECTITYGDLCSRAGVPFLTRNPGPFLLEIARWCQINGWPPINALAVNGETRVPGYNYDVAPGCDLLQWPRDVDAVIACQLYPRDV